MQLSLKKSLILIAGALAYTAEGSPVSSIPSSVTADKNFRYYLETTTEYQSAVAAPTSTTTYAQAYSNLESLITGVSTSTWGNWYPNVTDTATDTDDPYGQYAWSKLWQVTDFVNFTRGIYSTTVSPTPVPTSSLVLPPEDPVDRAYSNLGVKFPSDFVLGVAGSAAQIEGAVADEGRSPSIMDFYLIPAGEPENYVTNENYYLYKQDIARLAAAGVEHYSFSIPWTRILPFAYEGTPVNQEGIDHYDDLINTVLEYGMKPIITLTHFDSPAQFFDNTTKNNFGYFTCGGGYPADYFVDAFVYYAKIVMTHYADRVPYWVTFNEPYGLAENAQGVKNVVMAHAKVFDFYHNELGGTGKVGIKFGIEFGFPNDPDDEVNVAGADRYNELNIGMFSDPLYLGKDWPESFKKTILPITPNATWSAEELAYVKGKADFLGVDPYTYTPVGNLPSNTTVEECQADSTNEYWPACVSTGTIDPDGWEQGYVSQSYVYITPRHLRTFLNYAWNSWNSPVFITEFGFPEWRESEKELGDQQYDLARSIYYRSFLTAALEASAYDGVDMVGALGWSFADNWEFGDYEQQFGMQVVNRTTMDRYYKKSLFNFINFIRDNREE